MISGEMARGEFQEKTEEDCEDNFRKLAADAKKQIKHEINISKTGGVQEKNIKKIKKRLKNGGAY